jgi:hypothetical protein
MWTNNPSSFTYEWERDGTPLVDAAGSTYVVQTLDEGTTLTCVVTAKGGAPATSAGVAVPVPVVARCPAATGIVSGQSLGPLRLGVTRAKARKALPRSSSRGTAYEEFFCLTPIGVRVGFTSPTLLRTLHKSQRRRLAGRVVWISSSNPRYAIDGVRPGATLTAAQSALPHGTLLTVGRNDWYLAPAGRVTSVLKVRRELVEEVGIADPSLTRTRRARQVLMRSFE